ncbi:MAG: sulfite exporter TauE/SafE family protein [Planctomycetes bacterium]|nr:sulfite exporter TauE/SafE family protein [Planctomycetota bacterium]
MDATTAAALFAAGGAMGFINNLAGAGGLIGLAALDMAAGLSGSSMNASLRPAAIGVCAGGVVGFWSKGHRIPVRAWLLGLATVPGAVLGGLLVVTLPDWIYRLALILVVVTTLAQQLVHHRSRARSESRPAGLLGSLALFTLVGLHMGFLQVAVGLATMLALGRVFSRDLVAVNAAKTALLTVASCASVACLATTDAIVWTPSLWLAAGAATGSFTASRWTVAKGSAAVRFVVLAVCVLVLVRVTYSMITS